MRKPLVRMALPALSAHLTSVKFMYCDNKYYELCGPMGHLIAPSGIGKAQLTHLIEAICVTSDGNHSLYFDCFTKTGNR